MIREFVIEVFSEDERNLGFISTEYDLTQNKEKALRFLDKQEALAAADEAEEAHIEWYTEVKRA